MSIVQGKGEILDFNLQFVTRDCFFKEFSGKFEDEIIEPFKNRSLKTFRSYFPDAVDPQLMNFDLYIVIQIETMLS